MMRRKFLALGWAILAALSTSGCFLQLTLATRVAESLGEEIEMVFDVMDTQATTAICQADPVFSPNFRRCIYFVDGRQVTSTVNLLMEGGIVGVIIDPLVLEVPAGATVSGTYRDGTASGDLLVYPNLSHVPVDDTRTMRPAAGKQLVILDLPPNAPVEGVSYDFTLKIQQTLPRGSAPTEVKALLTARIRYGGKTYYPPLLPCTSNVSSVPSIRLASSSAPEAVSLSGPLSPCDNQNYQYFRPAFACDLDNDVDVDAGDIALIMNVRNRSAAAGDPRDISRDGVINANDARTCTLQCTRPGCR